MLIKSYESKIFTADILQLVLGTKKLPAKYIRFSKRNLFVPVNIGKTENNYRENYYSVNKNNNIRNDIFYRWIYPTDY